MAKLYGTEAAQEVIDQAVQIFGGTGLFLAYRLNGFTGKSEHFEFTRVPVKFRD